MYRHIGLHKFRRSRARARDTLAFDDAAQVTSKSPRPGFNPPAQQYKTELPDFPTNKNCAA
jgi:hypothetical protein